ncbi:AT-rich interactive domain-containing protein 4B [Trichomycterus rosablanca]|uniref:AT-rich interactive domain-containing protein 4B n=1 Tax=Trichomycterus rosablanca TaxID=2290929 RepID=UPI002F35E08F
MKTLEEPPYLTVGTDVSAKYRGAFCEAKIKTAKRLVKAKVTFKQGSSTAEVHDEHIRGNLKVGAVVEVKTQGGIYQEATINKLTDASLYTVVFDDGDEKTLRRSSLCIKGARHFAESETLDRLPLTNPEHFGTPVIGKKGNRGGRRSSAIQEDECSSSFSEDDDGDQQQNEELYGKVVGVKGIFPGEKKTTWYPALVISAGCHEDVTIKKDSVFVRSFKDGKFYPVMRKDIGKLDGEMAAKADSSIKLALDSAKAFQDNATVPSIWRTEVKDESSSSEENEEEGAALHEDGDKNEKEEEEIEPFPDEKEHFLQQLYKFMEDRNTPINKRPVLGYKNLNLFKLYRLVHKLGGFDSIESGSVWKQVYQDLGIPVLNSAAGYNVKCAYRKYLYGFEDYCTSAGITFLMDLPFQATGRQAESNNGKTAEASTRSTAASIDSEPNFEQAVNSPTIVKEEKAGEAENVNSKVDTANLKEDDKGCGDEVDNVTEIELNQPQAVEFNNGPVMKDFCMQRFMEEEQNKELSMYDEWIKAEKIVQPANKYIPKIKHRKKIENKKEKGRIEKLNDTKDHFLSKNHINKSSKFNNSKDVFLQTKQCIDKCCQKSPDKSLEVTSTFSGCQESEISTDDSEPEHYNKGGQDEQDPTSQPNPQRVFPLDHAHSPLQLDSRLCNKDFKVSVSMGTTVEPFNQYGQETNRRKRQFVTEREATSTTKRKNDKTAECDIKNQCKDKDRCSRSGGHWLSNPKKLEERNIGFQSYESAQISSSSENDGSSFTETQTKEELQIQSKTKGLASKKYSGLKEKQNSTQSSGFWEIPDKRAKMTFGMDERTAGCRTKGQKDVWSSIQAQWPKKTLKELFSDSDTEAANSPPPVVPVLQEPSFELSQKSETSEEPQESQEKCQEYPSSGSNSILNTPPTTPESAKVLADAHSSSPPPQNSVLASSYPAVSSPSRPLIEECSGGRSESDSSMMESLGCEPNELIPEGQAGSPFKAFDINLSSNSNCSLNLSSSQESEQKSKILSCTQKRHREPQGGEASTKHKRNYKRLSLNLKKNPKTADSSDSEDQSICGSTAKSLKLKSITMDIMTINPLTCSARTLQSHKYCIHREHLHPKELYGNSHGAYNYKWSFQMSDLEKMTSLEKISFLQEKLQDIRNHYLSLKSEVASIDRRRKRMKKKEQKTGAAVALSSSSTSSSSLTAAVMLTLAEPTVSASSQNSGLSVECS